MFQGLEDITMFLDPRLIALIVLLGLFALGAVLVMLVHKHAAELAAVKKRHAEISDKLQLAISSAAAAKIKHDETSRKLRMALSSSAAASQSKSDFLASMSHELRTPLNAVIGFSELMANETFGPLGAARYKEYAGDINDSGKHLLAMINDILDLSRLDAGALTLNEDVIPFQAVIDPALRMIANQARKKNLTLVQDVPTNLPNILADERRIKQVVINLLTNAVKFTPEGGSITLRAWSDEAGLYFSVSDTGIGIAPDMIAKALEPFGQIDAMLSREHGGAGLGLPLSKQLMEAHGGSLVLESTLNAGTTVTVSLPASRMRDKTIRSAA